MILSTKDFRLKILETMGEAGSHAGNVRAGDSGGPTRESEPRPQDFWATVHDIASRTEAGISRTDYTTATDSELEIAVDEFPDVELQICDPPLAAEQDD